MNKKIIIVIIAFLVLFAGFIVIAQELGIYFTGFSNAGIVDFSYGWVKPTRWFRSNAGGLALEENISRSAALRNEYALAIVYAHNEEIPDFLLQYFSGSYLPEVHVLYKEGRQIKTQWILRDYNGSTRVNAVFYEPKNSNIDILDENGSLRRTAEIYGNTGYIEIFDANFFLSTEYRIFENGSRSRIDYIFNNNMLVNAAVSLSDNNEEFYRAYTDNYRYNRSLALRSIERIFSDGIQITYDDPVLMSFPRNVIEAAMDGSFNIERINLYPEFFGDISIEDYSNIVFETDERGRILDQILYDDDGETIWTISNTWFNNRIVSTLKTDGDIEYLAEYEYNTDGNKILELNYKNGVLERLVRTEGNIDTEELYYNNVLMLIAVWEDGRKISETMVR